MPGGDKDLALAHEWVISLWVPRHADSAAVLRLVGEIGTALAMVADDLSREAANDEGLPSGLDVES